MEPINATRDPAALVRAYRAASGLTQRQLAAKMQMPRKRLIRIEAGELADIRLSEVAAFERVLGLPASVWGPERETDTTTTTRRDER